ncbi:hypothetical protein, partial [Sideroxydans sp. CL21]
CPCSVRFRGIFFSCLSNSQLPISANTSTISTRNLTSHYSAH